MHVFNETPYPFGFIEFATDASTSTATLIVRGRFVLEHDGVCWAAPADFQIPPGPEVRHSDDLGNSLRTDSDLAPYKPRADCLFVGSAHAPHGRPVETLEVSFSVGPMEKKLWIYGDRDWVLLPDGHIRGDKPNPFTSMPLRHELAHGGLKSSYNKHGKGMGDVTKAPQGRMPMANILAEERSSRAPHDDVPSQGFGPIDPDLRPRSDLRGTFDEEWLYKRKPYPPKDFDFASFNSARSDQQVDHFLRGDEKIALKNLHPKHASYRSTLPGKAIRIALLGMVEDKVGFVEPNVHLDTCVVDMEEESLTLIWRARFAIDQSGKTEYTHALIAEEPVDASKPKKHYFDRLKKLVLEAHADDLPPPPPPPPPSAEELEKAEAEAKKATMGEITKALKDAKADDALIKIAQSEADPMKALEKMLAHAQKLVDGLPKPPK